MPSETASAPGAFTRRFVSWTLRHGKLLWAIAFLLAIPATWRTTNLYRHLRSDIEELLPRSAPSVVAIDELRKRMAGLQYLGVLVDVGSPRSPGGRGALPRRPRRAGAAVPGHEVSDVRTGFATERAFVENHAAALLDLEDLKTIRERIEDRLRWEYSKETGMLLDDKEPAPTLDFSDVEKKYSSAFGGSALEGSRFSSSKLGVTLMLIEVGGFSTSAAQSAALIERVRADMKALGGTGALRARDEGRVHRRRRHLRRGDGRADGGSDAVVGPGRGHGAARDRAVLRLGSQHPGAVPAAR